MNDYKIVIDPGHGGSDAGASGNGIIEKDLTLKISQYMYDRFKELGIPVTMTRTTDETVTPTERVDRILGAYGNNSDVIVISNHINAGGGDGAEVIYALRNNNNLSNKILNALEAAGQNVRKVYQRRLPSDTSKDYYFIHRNTGATQPVIVEYGFLDSTGDDVSQLKNNYEKYAEAVVRAVAEYLNVNYEPLEGNYYKVISGDSLYSIARKYGISVDELKKANNLTSNALSVGQILVIPTKDTTENQNTYTVVPGDSLYSIARKLNTTVDEIKNLNNLTTNNLSIGQVLRIPTKASDTNTYTVGSGDSLYSIAKKFGISVDKLKEANNLTSNLLSVGQILRIPVEQANNQPNNNNTTTTPTNEIVYVVQKGDNLYAIARKYNTTQDELMRYNNLTSNLLSIGQTLKIPVNQTTNNQTTYTVVSGDSLYSIAKRFNTTVDEIKRKNNLTSNNLQIGQKLAI